MFFCNVLSSELSNSVKFCHPPMLWILEWLLLTSTGLFECWPIIAVALRMSPFISWIQFNESLHGNSQSPVQPRAFLVFTAFCCIVKILCFTAFFGTPNTWSHTVNLERTWKVMLMGSTKHISYFFSVSNSVFWTTYSYFVSRDIITCMNSPNKIFFTACFKSGALEYVME